MELSRHAENRSFLKNQISFETPELTGTAGQLAPSDMQIIHTTSCTSAFAPLHNVPAKNGRAPQGR
jgi:hypothetical protein